MGEEVRRGGAGDSRPPEEPQRAPPLSRPLITELTTSSFLPHVMDVKKVKLNSASRGRQSSAKRSKRVLL